MSHVRADSARVQISDRRNGFLHEGPEPVLAALVSWEKTGGVAGDYDQRAVVAPIEGGNQRFGWTEFSERKGVMAYAWQFHIVLYVETMDALHRARRASMAWVMHSLARRMTVS